jgi:hypothetical protein
VQSYTRDALLDASLKVEILAQRSGADALVDDKGIIASWETTSRVERRRKRRSDISLHKKVPQRMAAPEVEAKDNHVWVVVRQGRRSSGM